MDFLRQIVSGPKNRFRENGYNLDLTYITKRIIAMAFPASGFEKIYRNSIDDVLQFLTQKHQQSYSIINISGRKIDSKKLRNINSYDWEDHCVPPMQTLFIICQKMQEYLLQSDNNIVAIHCNQGKGRTGTIICCFLLFCLLFTDSKIVMNYYAKKRFQKQGWGVTQPCQMRYIRYFHALIHGQKRSPSVVAITQIVLQGKSKLSHPYVKVKLLSSKQQLFNTKQQIVKYDSSKNITVITPKQQIFFAGDITIFLHNQYFLDKKVGRISINTAFIPDTNMITLQIHQISPDSLKKSKTFSNGFILTIYFKSICQCKNNIPIEQRCEICKSKLGVQTTSWTNIYNILSKQKIQMRKQVSQKILFGKNREENINSFLKQQ